MSDNHPNSQTSKWQCDSDCASHDDPPKECDCSALIAEARIVSVGPDKGCIIWQLADALENALGVIRDRHKIMES